MHTEEATYLVIRLFTEEPSYLHFQEIENLKRDKEVYKCTKMLVGNHNKYDENQDIVSNHRRPQGVCKQWPNQENDKSIRPKLRRQSISRNH